MAENVIYDLIIVGGGPGGLSAGIYAMRAALKTIWMEKGLIGGQINLAEAVENTLGSKTSAVSTCPRSFCSTPNPMAWK